LHRASPGRQAQVPALQNSPLAHDMPHAPQFFGLVIRFTQAPLHICPPGQAHTPA
jgi:hypothetical protein